jgi:DNA-binding beta-propeller fold protein YncE
MVRRVDLGAASSPSMVVSPDGAIVYVGDRTNGEVRFVDSTTGAVLHRVPASGIRDLAITPDGRRLFASAGQTIIAIDTVTRTALASPPVGGANAVALGNALSPDGTRIATATSVAAVTLVRTADMSIEAEIPIVTNVTGCASQPVGVAFMSNGLLVAWDSNCDALYQVDVGTRTQLTARSIATGRDSGASFNIISRLAVSTASNLAYALKEDANLAVMNPQTNTFTQIAMGDVPFAATMSPDGAQLVVSVVHRFNGGGADTLEVLDTASTAVQRLYTLSAANQSVTDMMIVASP